MVSMRTMRVLARLHTQKPEDTASCLSLDDVVDRLAQTLIVQSNDLSQPDGLSQDDIRRMRSAKSSKVYVIAATGQLENFGRHSAYYSVETSTKETSANRLFCSFRDSI
jgi:hypothetical protein